MKILQVMPEFGLAGAETMCENLTYELIKLGNEVVIVSLYDFHSAITERLEMAGVKVLYLGKKKGLDLSMIHKLKTVIKNEKPDVIHTHRYVMIYSVPASLFCKTKRIHTVHNVAEKEVGKAYRILHKLFFKCFGVIPVALSKLISKSISECYRINQNNIPVVFNGVDLSKCNPKSRYEFDDEIIILSIARFNAQKNHMRMIETFKMFLQTYNNAELWLIGDGDLLESIKEVVKNKEIENKVKFLGLKSDVHDYLTRADIYLMTSDYEGMPMTIIEAMGTGLPIVSTNVGGISDMIENGKEGLLTEKNTVELCEALVRLTSDEDYRNTLGQNALKKSGIFSSKKMAENYLDIYQEV